MKKQNLLIIILITFLCGLILFANTGFEKSNPEKAGRHEQIGWESVNVRKKPSEHSSIVGVLNHGATVILTGNTCEYFLKDPVELAHWTEIEFPDGTTAWIVTWALE